MSIESNFPWLYKRGVKGETRVWYMELYTGLEGAFHRVVSGIKDGAHTESGWTECFPKNVGKKNETTAEEQARSEIDNQYKKKSERGYFYDEVEIDNVPFTKPMLATDWEKRKGKVDVSKGVYAQPKLDGIRCIGRSDGLWTRQGKRIVSVPHIEQAVKDLCAEDPELVLDGELYSHALKDDFNKITSIVRKQKPSEDDLEMAKELEYHVYDFVTVGSFEIRNELVESCLDRFGVPDCLVPVETRMAFSEEFLDDLYAEWIEQGYEGQMIRTRDSLYQNKRSNYLMKRKDFYTDEYAVAGIFEGKGNWAGYIKRFSFYLPDGRECGAGVRGNQEALRDLMGADTPDWCTVRYFEPTPDGMPRFPVVVDWGWGQRED